MSSPIRGLVFALPVSLLLWAIIIWTVWQVAR